MSHKCTLLLFTVSMLDVRCDVVVDVFSWQVESQHIILSQRLILQTLSLSTLTHLLLVILPHYCHNTYVQ